ncbi:hypothetical protein MATR_21210 [Marivirga tractuosa]|uniref:Uncharacterized protein n=1 Tax=Marivirga tractuosa (strain ATCC 23168 / DSM 4126 / NBRC 15989 / NCIMB 1408 / VKM B-1430 / H-43) TaxID=643867 RepID=E4TLX1_MARTH|nr:hypothetical protein [Marivirga tractuosa]ADR20262.1 hypothetical protein Ftrac_0251 [Marivirga tractuosa DSM 4126]BDD15296.1 hypothetical protein MATR_21210 [Marivirga tractuosa]
MIDLYFFRTKFKISRKRKPTEFRHYLKSNVLRTKDFGLFGIRKPKTKFEFEGIIEGDKFMIRRILKNGANSFIPIIEGKITENENSVKIEMEAKFHRFVHVFLLFFLCFNLLIFILLFVSGNFFNLITVISLLLIFGSIILPAIALKYEIRKLISFISRY